MDLVVSVLMCAPLALVSYRFGSGSLPTRVLSAFVAVLGLVTVSGYILSAFDLLASRAGWIIVTTAIGIPIRIVGACWSPRTAPEPFRPILAPARAMMRPIAWSLVAVITGLSLLQLILVLVTAPHNNDSMTYHMPRVGYYLQHGNIAAFDSNFWAQLMHPKNSAIAMSYLVLLGHGWTNAAQLLQLISWPAFVVANYGICTRLSIDRRAALIASICSGLIVEVLMQATTTQDDLYIAALGAALIYFALGVLKSGRSRELGLLAVATGLAFGTKSSSIIMLVSAGVMVSAIALHARHILPQGEWWRRLLTVGLAGGLGCVAFGLPAGYWENLRIYGSPFGDESVMRIRSISAPTIGERLRLGSVNVERYVLDFLDPSGLPDTSANRRNAKDVKLAAAAMLETVGPDLAAAPTLAPPYVAEAAPVLNAHEDLSYWGLWAPIFFLPVICAAFLVKTGRALLIALLGAACIFWLLQSFLGVYDPWRGRYFIQTAIFLVPAVAIGLTAISRSQLATVALIVPMAVCCAVSFNSIWYRKNSPWLQAVHMDWTQQVTRNTPELEPVVRQIERMVPQNAAVIVSINMAYSEFPLFGERMTRRLYAAPSNQRYSGLLAQNVADFAIFNQVLTPIPGDCFLGAGFYLRTIKGRLLADCTSANGSTLHAQ